MDNDWKLDKWGNIISLEYGKALRGYQNYNGKYKVYGANGPVGWTDDPIAKGPGVILGRKGANRGVAYSEDPFFVIDTAYYVKPKIDLHMRWLYYAIKGHKLGEIDDGSPIPSTTRSAVYVREVRVPPIEEQRAIAHILGTLDDKIELNRRMNRTLEQMAQAIFKSWFIDFDPVVYNAVRAGNTVPERFAETAARYREHPEMQTLPKDVLALFPDRFEQSELGDVPVGWEVKPIGEVLQCVGGGTPSTKNPEYWEGGRYPFLTPKDMSKLDSPIIVETERYITKAGVEKISSKQIPVGSVMLSSRAPIGYLGINEVPVTVNQGIIAMVCDGELPNYYVLNWVQMNMETIKSQAGGTTFAEISKKNFKPIPILIPSNEVLSKFSEIVSFNHRLIVENEVESSFLSQLRDDLLSDLISGKIMVSGYQKLTKVEAL